MTDDLAQITLTDAERDALIEALRYDRCEYGCAITYTQEAVKYDLAPAVERILSDRLREAQAAALQEVAADLRRNHNMPPRKDRPYTYRNGWWDGVHHAAKVVERAARETP